MFNPSIMKINIKLFLITLKKIVLFAILIVATLTLSSCSKDKRKQIEGTWKVTSYIYNDFDRVEGEGELWIFEGGDSNYPDCIIEGERGWYSVDSNGNLYIELYNDSRWRGDLRIVELNRKTMKVAGVWEDNVYNSYSETVELTRM